MITITKEALTFAFRKWETEAISNPHQFLNATRTAQMTIDERAVKSAEYLLQLIQNQNQ